MLYETESGWRLYGVQSQDVEKIWPMVLPDLRTALALDAAHDTEESLLQSLKEKERQLWVAFNKAGSLGMVAVTEVFSNKRRKTCSVLYASGKNYEEWLNFYDVVIPWAKSLGCQCIEVSGRKGWEKVKKNIGFRVVSVNLRKEI